MRRSGNGDDRAGASGPAPVAPAGRPWRFGTPATVQWIQEGIVPDGTITTAIPPVFPTYATVVEADCGDAVDPSDQEHALVEQLTGHGTTQWWLGYLDTGAHDVVFPQAPRVPLYWDWPYVLVQAGPGQALRWRRTLPDLIFPLDRSWLFTMLWDDGWTCIGGPSTLIEALAVDSLIGAQRVQLGEDPTPPGRVSL